ncbi:dephospho-CoA kinase [Hoeflea phototrophica DFL-43]|uniref:Dephospho-CoA kinase n=1 Tax=Hoeflea phototrophica (strain DSM 17068 / NCIMB 14078 / DFL-43) TaxID=411684 RepID=A9CUR0_HOEPD|nr:dephospho-CoA kinase [Hoeflea phototrophica]EDQ35257.1 dephospho-CoA kinase [Hoeflea phototrophica DFL-43]
MIVIGLTGSIGMGKSTTAEMFKAAGVPVISADEIVHELYRGDAVKLVEAAFPGSTSAGIVDRQALLEILLRDPAGFKRLEAIIHPLVREREHAFLNQARIDGHAMALLDIPLLYETGGEKRVDTVVVVSCDPDIQRQRVLARPGMTEDKFDSIVARQLPDAEKRARADFVIDTGKGLEPARWQVADIISQLGENHQD